MALNLRFQDRTCLARCRPVPLCLLLLLALPATARELCAFTAQGLSVVARDTTAEGGDGVEIDVSDGPLVLTRVAIPAADGASGCWQADLDRDRQFELLVGLVQDKGAQPARLVRFEWNGSLLEALPMATLTAAQALGYAGDEHIDLRRDLLIRRFAVGDAEPRLGASRHFRYAPETDTWIRLQALKRAPGAGDSENGTGADIQGSDS
jgi:hypothetical protein